MGPSTITRFAIPVVVWMIAMTVMPGPASAHRMHLNELITESSVHRSWVRTMGVDIMRAALKIDERASLERLRETRLRIVDSLATTREGGAELKGRGADGTV